MLFALQKFKVSDRGRFIILRCCFVICFIILIFAFESTALAYKVTVQRPHFRATADKDILVYPYMRV